MARAGRASVEVLAEVAGFGTQLSRDLNKQLRSVKIDVAPVSNQIGDGIRDGVKDGEKALGDLGDAARDALEDVVDQARETGDQLGDQIGDGADAARDALEDVGDKARETGDQLGEQIGDGADEAADAVEKMASEAAAHLKAVDGQIERVQASVKELAQEFARTGDKDIFVKIRNERATLANLHRIRAALDEVGDEAEETARKVADVGSVGASGLKSFHTVLSGLLGTAVSAGTAAVGVLSNFTNPAGWIAMAAGIGAVGALLPVVFGLIGALADLAGLVVTLPAFISVLAAVMIPLKVAFAGVGDAIEAIVEGDPEKIKEAFEGLAPAARSVLKEFQALQPALDKVGDRIQNAFFLPLKGKITEVAKTLLPSLSAGLASVSGELGDFGRHILNMVKSPQAVALMNDVFETTTRIIDKAGPVAQTLVDIFIMFGQTALPYVEDFADWLFRGAENLGELVTEAEKTGALQDFLDDAVDTLSDLWDLLAAVGRLFVTAFSDADDEGRDFIESLTEAVDRLTEWIESGDGQKFFAELKDGLKDAGVALQGLVGVTLWAIGVFQGVRGFLLGIGDAAKDTGGWFKDLGSTIGDAFTTAYDAVAGFFSDVGDWFAQVPGWFADIGSSIGDAFSSAWESVQTFFSSLGTWFSELPGRVAGWMSEFAQNFLQGLESLFQGALFAIGVGLGLLLFAILELPGLIWDGLSALPGILAEFFTNLWADITRITVESWTASIAWLQTVPGMIWNALVVLGAMMASFFTGLWSSVRNTTVSWFNSTVDWLSAVPGRVGRALERLPGVARSIISSMVSGARSAAVSGFNSLVSWVRSVPGRLSSLGGRFLSAGRNIIAAFFRGLRQVGKFASDVGRAITSGIRGSLNSMIGSINSGIARVDAVLPGSLPRIPYLARGGMTLSPTLAALSETGQREIVLPVDDPRTMAALRAALGFGDNGPQVVFAEGAIAVTFSGVVPTEDEAYRTGRAVGRGIASTLARSDVTTQIGTI